MGAFFQLTQIEVVCAEPLQALSKGLLSISVVGVIEFGGQEEIAAGDTGSPDSLANLLFVSVCGGGVNVLVAVLERKLNGVLDGSGGGFPGALKLRGSGSGVD